MSVTRMRQEVCQSINSAKRYSVEEYRDLISEAWSKGTDYHACVTDAEKINWLPYAERVRIELTTSVCDRAKEYDREKAKRASARLGDYIHEVHAIKGANQ
jgi:hypothetical protein